MESSININELFENAMSDPSVLSTIDIEKLLESIENDKNDYLENKTMRDMEKEIFEIVNTLELSSNMKLEYCKKLVGYRYIDSINEIHKGKHIRWINKKGNLTTGGLVVDIKFTEKGTHILCKNNMNRFIEIKYDECNIFQKMTMEEQMILMAYDYIHGAESR
jgi:hypothetical protein